jgi:chromosome segregation ATPase
MSHSANLTKLVQLTATANELSGAFIAIIQENEVLKGTVAGLQVERDNLVAENAKLAEENRKQAKTIRELTADKEKINGDFLALQDIGTRLSKNNEVAIAANDRLCADLNSIMAERDMLRRHLNTERSVRRKIASALNNNNGASSSSSSANGRVSSPTPTIDLVGDV